MDEQPMLTRDLVLRVCAGARELDLDWIAEGRKVVVPFTAGRDVRLVERIVAAGHAAGVDRLLVCRTRGEHAYEPVTQIEVRTSALLGLIRSWGTEPTDFLVALEDRSGAVLVTGSKLTVAAGRPLFLRALVGPDLVKAREDFVEEAQGSRDPDLVEAARRYECIAPGAQHARSRGPGPDLAERLGRRGVAGRQEATRRTAVLRTLRGAWAWAALAALLVAVALVADLSPMVPLTAATLWLMAQLAWMARSRTVSFGALPRMVVLGAAVAVPAAAVERVLAASLGLAHGSPYAYAYVAVPVEELAKLLPLLLLWPVARRRLRRLAAVDYLLLAAAAGAGFHLVEQMVRLVVARTPEELVWPQISVLTVFPGALDAASDVTFSGHGVTTGLVGGAIGLAVVGARRYGRWLWLLPLAALWIAGLEHLNYNAVVVGLDREPATAFAFALIGNGSATPWLLGLMLVAAVLMDQAVSRAGAQATPPLPGEPPLGRLTRWAAGRSVRLNVRIPSDIAPFFRRAARAWADLPLLITEALSAILHELAVQVVAASRGPAALCAAWRFLRLRREQAMGAARADGRPWRRGSGPEELAEVRPRVDGLVAVGLAACLATALSSILAWALAPFLTTAGPHAAYAAVSIQAGAAWYSDQAAGDRGLAVLAVAALVMLLLSGWQVPHVLPPMHAFLREPMRRLGAGLGALAPGQVPYLVTGLLGLALPRRVDRLLPPAKQEA